MTAPAPTGVQPPGCSAASASRIAGAAGLTFGVLSLIGIVSIGHFPKSAQPGTEFVSFLTDHRSSILTTNVLLSLANGALLVFFAYLRPLLSAGGRSSTLPMLAFGASVLFCALGAAGRCFQRVSRSTARPGLIPPWFVCWSASTSRPTRSQRCRWPSRWAPSASAAPAAGSCPGGSPSPPSSSPCSSSARRSPCSAPATSSPPKATTAPRSSSDP